MSGRDIWSVGATVDEIVVVRRSSFVVRRLEVLVQPFLAALTPKAALAVAAKAGRRIEHVGRVDPDYASLDLARDIERQVDILAPDAGGQAEAGIVGQRHRLGRRAEGGCDQHGPEDLDLGDRGGGRDIGEQRGRKEVALGWAGPGWLPHGCALGTALLDKPLDLL